MHGSHAADRKRAREADSDSDAASEDHDEAPQKQMRGEAAARSGTGGQKKPLGGKPVGMSRYKGVTLNGNRWVASVWKEGKQHYLGSFVNPEEASVAVRHFEETGEKKPEWRHVAKDLV